MERIFRQLNKLPEKLTRITSGGKLIREIDGLRFMAIIPVLVQHLNERFLRNTTVTFAEDPANSVINFLAARGFLGVYLFFVISGFILALPFATHRLKGGREVNYRAYYWRRVTRLEPPYIVWMTIFYIIFVFINGTSFAAYLPNYLAGITYTHSLIFGEWSPFNPPTWTLEIEVQFYLLAPLLALLFFSIRNKVVRRIANIGILLLMMGLQQYGETFRGLPSLTILGHIHYFIVGFLLADLFICDWHIRKKRIAYDVLAVGAFACLIVVWSWNFEFLSRILVISCLFLFFYSVFRAKYVNTFLTNRWITSIGGMCYTIYLIHLPLAELFIRITKHFQISNSYGLNLLVQLLLYIPVVLVISAFSYLIFEKPFMNKYWPNELKLFLKRKLKTQQSI
ncbi:acyltransferase family protein [Parapedobacter defluvii]|uniref:acyltransferase family protein n=1 Tax=Parapedobacter defluvii TaxID=2045106 RepID=UPI001664A425|nr:acyltransferase [Parapedobacter defluvii]